MHLATELLIHALNASSDAVEIADVKGPILFVNDAWCRLFRRTRRDVIGVAWDSLVPNDAGSAELKTSWMRCLSIGTSEGVHELRHTDGTFLSIGYGAFSILRYTRSGPNGRHGIYPCPGSDR